MRIYWQKQTPNVKITLTMLTGYQVITKIIPKYSCYFYTKAVLTMFSGTIPGTFPKF